MHIIFICWLSNWTMLWLFCLRSMLILPLIFAPYYYLCCFLIIFLWFHAIRTVQIEKWLSCFLNFVISSSRLDSIITKYMLFLYSYYSSIYFVQILTLALVNFMRVLSSWPRRLKVVLLDRPQTLEVNFFLLSYYYLISDNISLFWISCILS